MQFWKQPFAIVPSDEGMQTIEVRNNGKRRIHQAPKASKRVGMSLSRDVRSY
jgi:hypothetical protein